MSYLWSITSYRVRGKFPIRMSLNPALVFVQCIYTLTHLYVTNVYFYICRWVRGRNVSLCTGKEISIRILIIANPETISDMCLTCIMRTRRPPTIKTSLNILRVVSHFIARHGIFCTLHGEITTIWLSHPVYGHWFSRKYSRYDTFFFCYQHLP